MLLVPETHQQAISIFMKRKSVRTAILLEGKGRNKWAQGKISRKIFIKRTDIGSAVQNLSKQ